MSMFLISKLSGMNFIMHCYALKKERKKHNKNITTRNYDKDNIRTFT